MKKRICYLISVSVLILLNACSPMDYKYKEFTEDGPITYLAKLNVAEVKVIGERNRVRFILPKLADPRTTQAIVYWSTRKVNIQNRSILHRKPVSTSTTFLKHPIFLKFRFSTTREYLHSGYAHRNRVW